MGITTNIVSRSSGRLLRWLLPAAALLAWRSRTDIARCLHAVGVQLIHGSSGERVLQSREVEGGNVRLGARTGSIYRGGVVLLKRTDIKAHGFVGTVVANDIGNDHFDGLLLRYSIFVNSASKYTQA
jgi:hypothetical protein